MSEYVTSAMSCGSSQVAPRHRGRSAKGESVRPGQRCLTVSTIPRPTLVSLRDTKSLDRLVVHAVPGGGGGRKSHALPRIGNARSGRAGWDCREWGLYISYALPSCCWPGAT